MYKPDAFSIHTAHCVRTIHEASVYLPEQAHEPCGQPGQASGLIGQGGGHGSVAVWTLHGLGQRTITGLGDDNRLMNHGLAWVYCGTLVACNYNPTYKKFAHQGK